MVRQMKQSEQQHFNSKMALKAKILTDLREEDKFEQYMAYILYVKKHLQKKLKLSPSSFESVSSLQNADNHFLYIC